MSLETYVPSENVEIKNLSVGDKLRELDEKVGVSQEVLNRLDPEWYGYFRYKKWDLDNFNNGVLNWWWDWENSSDANGSLVDNLEKVLLKYDKKEITPSMINSMISDLCDCEYVGKNYDGTKITYKLEDAIDYTYFWGKESLVWCVLAYVDYLQPKTANKVMEHSETVSIISARWSWNYWTFNQIKKFYDKLDANHKKMYYSKLFQHDWRIDDRWQGSLRYMRDDLWNYIFENPLSLDTFTKLKNFIEDVNEDWNWIKESRTSSKKAIDQLKNNWQITESQAKELYRAWWIKYEK